jgi:hypothetical protein
MRQIVIGLAVGALSSFALPPQSGRDLLGVSWSIGNGCQHSGGYTLPKQLGTKIVSSPWIEAKKTVETGPIRWSISVTRDKRGEPNSFLSIVAKRHKYIIAKVEGSEMKPMARDSYQGWNVPAKAVTACFGWFGGGGDIYSAIKRPHLLKVYHRAIDESDRKPQSAELVKAIRL